MIFYIYLVKQANLQSIVKEPEKIRKMEILTIGQDFVKIVTQYFNI